MTGSVKFDQPMIIWDLPAAALWARAWTQNDPPGPAGWSGRASTSTCPQKVLLSLKHGKPWARDPYYGAGRAGSAVESTPIGPRLGWPWCARASLGCGRGLENFISQSVHLALVRCDGHERRALLIERYGHVEERRGRPLPGVEPDRDRACRGGTADVRGHRCRRHGRLRHKQPHHRLHRPPKLPRPHPREFVGGVGTA